MSQPAHRDIAAILVTALRRLGKAGDAETAMKLGGEAWWAFQNDGDADSAEAVNKVMHYLARLLPAPGQKT
ncbi:MAG TPA: hypothetical protein VFQ96_07340 [Microbacteriaceae bacterium]|nr:hypothetical protein [Microbacteriaceae bacterium]